MRMTWLSTGREASYEKQKTAIAVSFGPFSKKKFIMTANGSISVTGVPTEAFISDVGLEIEVHRGCFASLQ